MKKIFTYALLAMAACMTSCSQNETLDQVNNTTVPSGVITFSAALPADDLQTRAADEKVQRFVMQIYNAEDKGVTDPNNISVNYTLVSADGNFTLDPTDAGMADGTYTAVFWADYDATDAVDPVYNTSWLNWVTVNSGKTMTMAYQGKQEFTVGETSTATPMNVTLKRAVAQVNLSQAEAFTAVDGDYIGVTYKTAQAFNVLTGEISTETIDASVSISVEAGNKAANETLGSFVMFASPTDATLVSFTFSYNDEEVETVYNAPIQANYQTNISGDYSGEAAGDGTYEFQVTTDAEFAGDNNEETEEGGETGEEGGNEPTEGNQAPFLGDLTHTVEGYNINYSIDVTDDKGINNWPSVEIYKETWENKIEDLCQYPNLEGSGLDPKNLTLSGTITVSEAGTYILCVTVRDEEGEYASKSVDNIVIE